VTLNGPVASEEEEQKYTQMAKKAVGVRTVNENLSVASVNVVPEKSIEESAVEEDIVFAPFDEEPLFDFLADDYIEEEEPVIMEVAEIDDAVSEQVDQVIEDVDQAVSNLDDAVEEMIEEPVIEAPMIAEPAENQLEEVQEEAVEIVEETVDVVTMKNTAECQAEISSLVAGKRINFETAQSKIQKSSLSLLDSLASEMTGCADMALHVHGHTDNVGDEGLNRKLSHSRAKSVGLYLLKQGVTQRIKIFGHGDDQPIASNDNEAGREENRRIEFTVVGLDDSVATDDPKTVKTKRVPRLIKERTIVAP